MQTSSENGGCDQQEISTEGALHWHNGDRDHGRTGPWSFAIHTSGGKFNT